MKYSKCRVCLGGTEMTHLYTEKKEKLSWIKRLFGYTHEHCKAFDYNRVDQWKADGVLRGMK